MLSPSPSFSSVSKSCHLLVMPQDVSLPAALRASWLPGPIDRHLWGRAAGKSLYYLTSMPAAFEKPPSPLPRTKLCLSRFLHAFQLSRVSHLPGSFIF